MSKPVKVDREFFGGYYMSKEPGKIWGVRPMHCYPCGEFDLDGTHYYLQYLRLSKQNLADVHGNMVEAFDLSCIDADEIVKDNSFLLAAANSVDVSELDVAAILSQFKHPAPQLVMQDMQAGYGLWEIFERRIAFLVVQFTGETFDDVLTNYPDILVETVNEEGDKSVNIWRNSQESRA